MSSSDVTPLLSSSGSERSVHLEQFRDYLHLVVNVHFGSQYRGKFDDSDIVQQTLLEAHKRLHLLRGTSQYETAAWLRRILATTLARAQRDLHRDKRDVSRERSLQAAIDASSQRLEAFLADAQSSPSRKIQRREEFMHVVDCLARLNDDYRQALILRHCQGLSLPEIAEAMGRTTRAVAGLLQRGAKQMRERLEAGDHP